MKDILGREINDNDIVVIKGNTKRDMEVGVFIGKSVRTMSGARVTQNMFLVENPGAKELAIKKDILDKIAKERAAAKAKTAAKSANVANEVGRVYQMERNDEIFLYCGQRLVTQYDENGNVEFQLNGHFYIAASYYANMTTALSAMDFSFFLNEAQKRAQWHGTIKTQKTCKKYKAVHHLVEIPDTFELHPVFSRYAAGKFRTFTKRIVFEKI